jgi:hypothetical protein
LAFKAADVLCSHVDLPLTPDETVVIVSVRVALPVPVLLVALSVTDDVPAAAGVPEINPVEVFTVNPAGNPVAP